MGKLAKSLLSESKLAQWINRLIPGQGAQPPLSKCFIDQETLFLQLLDVACLIFLLLNSFCGSLIQQYQPKHNSLRDESPGNQVLYAWKFPSIKLILYLYHMVVLVGMFVINRNVDQKLNIYKLLREWETRNSTSLTYLNNYQSYLWPQLSRLPMTSLLLNLMETFQPYFNWYL